MASLKRLIVEIRRRSLWQVLTVYLGASWAVMEATDQIGCSKVSSYESPAP